METDKEAIAELKILEAKKREAELEYQRLQAMKENPNEERIAELKEAISLEEKELNNIDEQIKKQEELLEKEKAAKLEIMNQENKDAWVEGANNEEGADIDLPHSDAAIAAVEAGNTGGPEALKLQQLKELRAERQAAHSEYTTLLQGEQVTEEQIAAAKQAAVEAEKAFSEACAATNHPLIARNNLLIKELQVKNANLKAELASAKTIKDKNKRYEAILKITKKIQANEKRIGNIQKKNQKIASGTQSLFSSIGNTLSTTIQSSLQGVFNKLGPIGDLLSQGLTSVLN